MGNLNYEHSNIDNECLIILKLVVKYILFPYIFHHFFWLIYSLFFLFSFFMYIFYFTLMFIFSNDQSHELIKSTLPPQLTYKLKKRKKRFHMQQKVSHLYFCVVIKHHQPLSYIPFCDKLLPILNNISKIFPFH